MASNGTSPRFTKRQWYTLVGIVAIAAIACVAILWFILSPTTHEPPSDASTQPRWDIRELTQDNVKRPPLPTETLEVFSYEGRVIAFDAEAQVITLATERGTKTVTITPSTQILRQERPDANEGVQPPILRYPTADPIRVDGRIIAESDTNIRGLEAFSASKILLIE